MLGMKSAGDDFNQFINDPVLIKELYIANDLQISNTGDLPSQIKVADSATRGCLASLTENASHGPLLVEETLSLLASVKSIINNLASGMIFKVGDDLERALDLEQIRHELTSDPATLTQRLHLVLKIVASICAPARDSQVTDLRSRVAPTLQFLKELFKLLDKMRVDMCNFLLRHHRSKILLHASNFEVALFQNCYSAPESLVKTRAWIRAALCSCRSHDASRVGSSDEAFLHEVLFSAYRALFVLSPATYPETVSLDAPRLVVLSTLFNYSVFVASMLNVLKKPLSELIIHDQNIELKVVNLSFSLEHNEMKDEVKMEEVAREILGFLRIEREKYGLYPLSAEFESFFVLKMRQLTKTSDPVWKLFESRIFDGVFAGTTPSNNMPSLHPSVQTLTDAIFRIRSVFRRFMNFNILAYSSTYSAVIKELIVAS